MLGTPLQWLDTFTVFSWAIYQLSTTLSHTSAWLYSYKKKPQRNLDHLDG